MLESPQEIFYLFFDRDHLIAFRKPVSSGYLNFIFGVQEKMLLLATVFGLLTPDASAQGETTAGSVIGG